MRFRSRLVFFVAACLGGVAAGVFLMSPSSSRAQADRGGEAERPAEPPSGWEEMPGRHRAPVFFKTYPAAEGDVVEAYEALRQEPQSEEDTIPLEGGLPLEQLGEASTKQEALDSAGMWAETANGHAVHEGWGRAAAERRRRGRARRNQGLSGTQNLDEIGVE